MKRRTGVTIKERHGEDYYRIIGAKGGQARVTKGFGSATPEQRREWGRQGGQAKSKRVQHENEKADSGTIKEESR